MNFEQLTRRNLIKIVKPHMSWVSFGDDNCVYASWSRQDYGWCLDSLKASSTGKGAGTAYLNEMLAAADEEGIEIRLSARIYRNMKFYRRFGFKADRNTYTHTGFMSSDPQKEMVRKPQTKGN